MPGLQRFSYTSRLQKLGLTTLQERKLRGDLIEVYNNVRPGTYKKITVFFQLAYSVYDLRGHTWKIKNQQSRLDIRKYSFSQRIVNTWNKLLQGVIDAQSVSVFKNRLDKFATIWTLQA